MEKRLRMFFNKEGDVLDISIGDPKEAISKEVGDDILIRVDSKSKEVLGITILNFEKRFEQRKTEIFPITAALAEAGI
ncbi:MAG: DUF2283 domain-containing protein [Euryarchaeota archaeon]|nr:DUF2283 domain-containing protein [Euryarchaeota archaeon]